MKSLFSNRTVAAALFCGSFAFADSRAETSVCSMDFCVFADWSASGDPQHAADFFVTFQDPNPPIIELRTGDDGWIIYVQNTSDDSPGDLAALLLDPSSPSENFVVTLANGSDPGARNV